MSTASLAISHWMPWKSAMVPPKASRCLHVLGGVHQRPLGQADPPGRDDRAHGVEAEHGQTEAADLADHVLGGHVDVVEEQLAGVDALHAHLAVGAPHRHARPSARSTMKAVIESWARDAGSPVLAKTRVPVGLAHTGHPALGAGEHPAALVPGAVSGAARVRMPATSLPACGLGEPEPGPDLTGGDTGQVALLLVVVAGDEHRAGRQPGEQQHQGGRVRVLGHLLDGDGQPEDARPPTRRARRGGRDRARSASRKASKMSVGVVAGRVDLPGPGLDLVLGQPADALLELGELGREVEVHGRRGYPRPRPLPARLGPDRPA